MSEEAELIRALAEDLALEILASYTSADDFDDADFSSLGKAAVYLEEHAGTRTSASATYRQSADCSGKQRSRAGVSTLSGHSTAPE